MNQKKISNKFYLNKADDLKSYQIVVFTLRKLKHSI